MAEDPHDGAHDGIHDGAQDDLPPWERVLAVVAHPDDESFGLGGVITRFVSRGARVHVLCLTEGEASTLGAGAGLSGLRREELAAASRELGVTTSTLHHHPDGALGGVCRSVLAGEVVDEVSTVEADGLLVFDVSGVTGHPDHVAATQAALAAADVLELPVLAWTLPDTVAAALNGELGVTAFHGRPVEALDLSVPVERVPQVAACRAHRTQAVPQSPLWRRLELLGDREHLRWLRGPRQPA